MNVTAQNASFVKNIAYDSFPPAAVSTAKTALRDCLGVALAGSQDQAARICIEIARLENAIDEATLIGQACKTSALAAAFTNGTAAHSLDFDHGFTLGGQPTAPIIPAVLALGESLGVSGRLLLEAYMTGFEVTAKMVIAARASEAEGWHAPGTLGIFGATAGCAKLLRLDHAQIEMALGIAASMASGIVANFGTMTKPLHVGHAARNGVLAARLAQLGFTGGAQAIEAKEVGFFDSFYRVTPAAEALNELGKSFSLETDGIKIKPYPCGGLTHQAIDATLALRQEHEINAAMVESIQVDVTKHTYSRIAFRVPETGIQGKFCMPYLISRAMIDGKIDLDIFTETAIRDPDIMRFAEKVEMRFDPTLKASDPGARPCRVAIRLKNGQTHSATRQHAKGGREIPLSDHELQLKFTECARQAISEDAAQSAWAIIARLETLEDIRPFCRMLAA